MSIGRFKDTAALIHAKSIYNPSEPTTVCEEQEDQWLYRIPELTAVPDGAMLTCLRCLSMESND